MIGYRISRQDLEKEIEKEKPGWLQRAKERKEKFRKLGRYEEASSIWSEVKPVYMQLQGGSKCAYCERKLESVQLGKGEQDVEHFRPKGNVAAWKPSSGLLAKGLKLATTPANGGYHLLAYNPFNYVASCKACNAALKRDYFPIAHSYDLGGEDPVALLGERPYLIYPLGDFDADPEALIAFHGVSPQAVAASGHERWRALVTIEFFRLDDALARKSLVRERAAVIVALYPQLAACDGGNAADKKVAKKIVAGYTAPAAPHTSCARSFEKLFLSDRETARALYEAAADFIDSVS
ncbi:MAG: hypothetical protein HC897_14765 [Thermoanaerobaculia bacterium]|nr:hypothetical protein [Thermoanaerobaculia bacterium]